MLKVDPSLNHVPAARESVVALFESINQPLVNIPQYGTSSTGAYVLGTRNDAGYFTVFVYLHQPDTKAVVIYVSEPRNLTAEQYRAEEAEAQRFVESMGFMVDDIRFPSLNVSEQEAVVARVPLFRPPERTVDLFEVADSRDVEGQEASPPDDPTGTRDFFGDGPSGLGSVLDAPGSTPPPPYRSGATPPGGTIRGTPLSGPPPSSGTHRPLTGPASGGPRSASRADAAEALKRIGRLLGTFCFLFLSSCQTTNPELERKVQSQLDLANQHLARGSWPDAVQAFEEILDVAPKNEMALRGAGSAYFHLGRYDDAERHLERALQVKEDWSMAKNDLAIVHIEQGRCDEAEVLLLDVANDIFYPTPAFARHNLARAQACQGRVDVAIETLEASLRTQPRFCLGYLTLSQMTEELQRPEETIRACERFSRFCEEDTTVAEEVAPQYRALCHQRRGAAYLAIGDVESARASLLRCEETGHLVDACRDMRAGLPP